MRFHVQLCCAVCHMLLSRSSQVAGAQFWMTLEVAIMRKLRRRGGLTDWLVVKVSEISVIISSLLWDCPTHRNTEVAAYLQPSRQAWCDTMYYLWKRSGLFRGRPDIREISRQFIYEPAHLETIGELTNLCDECDVTSPLFPFLHPMCQSSLRSLHQRTFGF